MNYINSPIAYTIDIGVDYNCNNYLIEVHNFYSVGLYGFFDYKMIPVMFNRWFYENIRKKYA